MIDLLRDEVNRNFPDKKSDEFFHLHCSPSFAEAILREFESFRDAHFFVADREDEPTKFSQFLIPGIGMINVLKDMLQGYRLECVSCGKEEEAPFPEHITILDVFPHLSNTYHADKNIFKKGDVLMDGRERYTILSGPEIYLTRAMDPDSWVYTFDKPLKNPIGKKLIKEYIKN